MDPATDNSSWADYSARKHLFVAVLVPGLFGVLFLAGAYLVERHGWHGLTWPLAAWVVAVAYAGRRLQAFRCPRCQHHFFRRSPPLLALRATRCVNCMLSKE